MLLIILLPPTEDNILVVKMNTIPDQEPVLPTVIHLPEM